MKEIIVLSFDIGGTNIKWGLFKEDHTLFKKGSFPTRIMNNQTYIMNDIISFAKEIQKEYTLRGIAISTAGIINHTTGEVLDATDKLPKYKGTKIKAILEDTFKVPVYVENDVKCFLIAEHTLQPNLDNFVVITIGTGIGGASFINGKLYHGAIGGGNEFGRMNLNEHTTWEDCGSIKSIVDRAKKKGLMVNSGLDLFKLYDKKDPVAELIINDFYRYLGLGISNLIYAYLPSVFIIGGGISARGQKFIDELIPSVNLFLDPFYFNKTKICLATFHNDTGLYGAYHNFINNTNK